MNEEAHVLLLDPSAVSRGRLRDELNSKYSVKVAQNIPIARARAESMQILAAVVGLSEATPDELEFLRWLTRQAIPTFVVMRAAIQERKLSGTGVSTFCVRDENDPVAHAPRISRWLDGLLRRSRLSMLAPAHQKPSELAIPQNRPLQRPSGLPADPAASELVICIGVSTGGPEALEVLLSTMPSDAPPIVIVQHMPVGFTQALAKRLNAASRMEVSEAKGDEVLVPGRVWIAPGDQHLVLRRSAPRVLTNVVDGPLVDRHRPSVNVLFESAARVLGSNAIGVIMTGMGDDGARGLLAMKQAGALTVGQDASTSTVYGMPQRAAAIGAVDYQVPLGEMAQRILELASGRARRRAAVNGS